MKRQVMLATLLTLLLVSCSGNPSSSVISSSTETSTSRTTSSKPSSSETPTSIPTTSSSTTSSSKTTTSSTKEPVYGYSLNDSNILSLTKDGAVYYVENLEIDINDFLKFYDTTSGSPILISPIAIEGENYGFTTKSGVVTASKKGKYSFGLEVTSAGNVLAINKEEEDKHYYLVYADSTPAYDIEQGIELEPISEGSPVYYGLVDVLVGEQVRITDGENHYYSYDLESGVRNAYLEHAYTIKSNNDVRFNVSFSCYIEFDTSEESNNILFDIKAIQETYRIYETNMSETYWQKFNYQKNTEETESIRFYKNDQVFSTLKRISVRFVYKSGETVKTTTKSITLGSHTPSTFTLYDNEYITYSGDTKKVYNVTLYENINDLSLVLDFVAA